MLSNADLRWLSAEHPDLCPIGMGIVGTVSFSASYNSYTNRFVRLREGEIADAEAVTLPVEFEIEIVPRTVLSDSKLPALRVKGAETSTDRHFGQKDKTACLCSPLDEAEYLCPDLDFKRFFAELVLPFLYGQAFYSIHKRWPWDELAHGAMGILESYRPVEDRTDIERYLVLVKREAKIWNRLLNILQGRVHLKSAMPCLCGSNKKIQSCHPLALSGTSALKRDLRRLGLLGP